MMDESLLNAFVQSVSDEFVCYLAPKDYGGIGKSYDFGTLFNICIFQSD